MDHKNIIRAYTLGTIVALVALTTISQSSTTTESTTHPTTSTSTPTSYAHIPLNKFQP